MPRAKASRIHANLKMPGVDVLSVPLSVSLSLSTLTQLVYFRSFFLFISLLTRQEFGVGKMTSKSGPKDY